MRFANATALLFALALAPSLSAAGDIVERALVMCQQQVAAAPVVALASIQSSEILVPVASTDLPPEDLPPQEGRLCAELLSDLTREGFALVASTPILKRSPKPQENFLLREPPVTEQLQWTIRLPGSIAMLLCNPLTDAVIRFSDGASPSDFFVPPGASCTVHLAAILVQGGEILSRTAVWPAGAIVPVGPSSVYTAYELMRRFPAGNQPRLPRINNGRDRLP
jgi:hypothetical protein